MNVLRLSLLQEQLEGVAEIMGQALARSAFSPNIRVRLDFSCALFTPEGELLAQAAHIPVHLGSMPDQIKELCRAHSLRPGDLYIANDPYQGGTHLPDITLMRPVFDSASKLIGVTAARAHHADVGGATPGSMANQKNIYADGLRIPITRLMESDSWDRGLLELLLCNMRSPQDREGDLMAQFAACLQGERGLLRAYEPWMSSRGGASWEESLAQLFAASRQGTLKQIAQLFSHRQTARFSDELETGPFEVPIRVRISRSPKGRFVASFEGTGSAPDTAFHATRAVTLACIAYALRCFLSDDIPVNQGFLDCIELSAPSGSVVCACYPQAVAGGNVETSQRIVDVLLGALSNLDSVEVPAASCGTMNNLSFGFQDPKFGVHYETSGGGAGASSTGPVKACSGVQVHMTNTKSTPVEVLESAFPIRVESHKILSGSGGAGKKTGGDGTQKVVTFLEPAWASFLCTRRRSCPYGRNGGASGQAGSQAIRLPGEPWEEVEGSSTHSLPGGSQLRLRTPGGGGFGDPND